MAVRNEIVVAKTKSVTGCIQPRNDNASADEASELALNRSVDVERAAIENSIAEVTLAVEQRFALVRRGGDLAGGRVLTDVAGQLVPDSF